MQTLRKIFTKKNILKVALTCLLFVMALGYAAFSQKLEINGTAKIDMVVGITNMTYVSGTTCTNSYDITVINLRCVASGGYNMGSTYNVTVKNYSTKTVQYLREESSSVQISCSSGGCHSYSLSGLYPGMTIAAGGTLTFSVVISSIQSPTMYTGIELKLTLHFG